MPNTSWNSSREFTEQNQEELKKISYPHPQEMINHSNDWFYGTEELLDALPRRWTRSLLYLLIGFTVTALPWSMLSKVDETGNARGRIEPKGATQKLDSSVSGSVIAVRVKEGETVRAGQILLELESDVLKTQLKEVQTKLEGEKNRLAQLDLLENQLLLSIRVQEQQNQSQQREKTAQLNQAKQVLDAKQSTYNLQKLEKKSLVNQAQQQIISAQNDEKSVQKRLNIDTKQVERFSKLIDSGAVSTTQVDNLKKEEEESKRLYEKAQSDIKQAELNLVQETSRYQTTINQLESDIKQANLRLQEEQSSYQSLQKTGKLTLLKSQEQLRDLQSQITAMRSQIAQSSSQVTSVEIQLGQRILRSPVDGTIFTLPVTKPGSVVEAGETIAQIAPKNTAFILKAQMSSEQSGFLRKGMPVKIKFDAYPFQDYGVLKGHVDWISPDSKIQENNQVKTEFYDLEVTLERPYIKTENKLIELTAGQTATAEVIIRQRRIIDFMLDPFKKLQKGGLDL
ncbi:HlyD family efflux transporter periplasmic adaptor subunit [Calothrix sp. PCC 6303]|uniref:HlyD family efflux transporter periplasmic adaptor subunit n=1 Tax=Calothrix sp. PCC 6303 TaxID=1170562 RepID=UPI0002A027A3|nr:HlyD family efflux transporter periplasmic adaptor subunit [Calothrix sp. PCC 6303]AFZ00979.1 biotin/lipoyl attachment domain-containing protein [Calothrix sp. PCC 6303]